MARTLRRHPHHRLVERLLTRGIQAIKHKAGQLFEPPPHRSLRGERGNVQQSSKGTGKGEYFALKFGEVGHGVIPVVDRVMTG